MGWFLDSLLGAMDGKSNGGSNHQVAASFRSPAAPAVVGHEG